MPNFTLRASRVKPRASRRFVPSPGGLEARRLTAADIPGPSPTEGLPPAGDPAYSAPATSEPPPIDGPGEALKQYLDGPLPIAPPPHAEPYDPPTAADDLRDQAMEDMKATPTPLPTPSLPVVRKTWLQTLNKWFEDADQSLTHWFAGSKGPGVPVGPTPMPTPPDQGEGESLLDYIHRVIGETNDIVPNSGPIS